MKFPEGGEGLNPRKTFHGRGMDILWKNTILVNSCQAWLIQRNAMTHPLQYLSHYCLFFVPVKCPYNSLQESNLYNMAYDHIIYSYLGDATRLSRGQIWQPSCFFCLFSRSTSLRCRCFTVVTKHCEKKRCVTTLKMAVSETNCLLTKNWDLLVFLKNKLDWYLMKWSFQKFLLI